MSQMMRNEYPNPIFERKNWENLNGEWDFEIDNSVSGVELNWYENPNFTQKICVPFCPESELSGINNKAFMNSVWYKKNITVTEKQLNGRIFLHIGACDFETTVYINGGKVGTHIGGYSHFDFDITEFVFVGENTVVIYAYDDVRDSRQWRGKQSELYHSHGCDYTRTTGIWQTVWLEYTPKNYIKSIKVYPNIADSSVMLTTEFVGSEVFTATAKFNGEIMGSVTVEGVTNKATLVIPLKEKYLWELGEGNLYDLELTYGDDEVFSYFGLREVEMDGMKFMLNGKSVFQRLVLDQGFYPDGIYTAKSTADMRRDIEMSMEMGFNGARLHQKVFEPTFLYFCDKMGYMVWGETGSWGFDFSDASKFAAFTTEWIEILNRDFNHPSIIGWCPMNESWNFENRRQDDNSMRLLYRLTKTCDPTRICIDTSGGYHVETDIYDLHDYIQDGDEVKKRYSSLEGCGDYSYEPFKGQQAYNGEARFLSEYGGAWWNANPEENETSWGYGNAPKSVEEFLERYESLTNALMEDPKMMGLCYTQLYDVEQEKNGLYTYDRKPKFDAKRIYDVNIKKAAIEK